MKKEYLKPEAEIVSFVLDEVITYVDLEGSGDFEEV